MLEDEDQQQLSAYTPDGSTPLNSFENIINCDKDEYDLPDFKLESLDDYKYNSVDDKKSVASRHRTEKIRGLQLKKWHQPNDFFIGAKFLEDCKYFDDPRPEDLSDLFNFEFTKPLSCFNEDEPISQSAYLFLQKFDGNEGIIKFLKSSFDQISYLEFPTWNKHHRYAQTVQFNNDTRGIRGDEKDIAWRQEFYGKNIYPKKKSKSLVSMIIESFKDYMMRILLASAMLIIILGWATGGKQGDVSSGTVLLAMFIIFNICQSILNYTSQQKLLQQEESKKFHVSVYRNSQFSSTIPIDELLVGDIYRVTAGMIIPADSILIQTGHPLSVGLQAEIEWNTVRKRQVNPETIEQDGERQYILCMEEEVTGEQDYKKKSVITMKDYHLLKQLFVQKQKVPHLDNVLLAKSQVVLGQGIAIACAVGSHTQIGISINGLYQVAQNPIKHHKTQLRDLMEEYFYYITAKSNQFGFLFVFVLIVKELVFLYWPKYFQPEQQSKSDLDYLADFLDVNTVCMCLIVALIPQAMKLAHMVCLAEYSKHILFKTNKISFSKIAALEKLGSVDCICLEKEGTLTMSDCKEVRAIQMYGISSDLQAGRGENKYPACNFFVHCIYFSCTAWTEKLDPFNIISRKHRKKAEQVYGKLLNVQQKEQGNLTERALLRFLSQRFSSEFKEIQGQKIEVLHWSEFNSQRKRSTIVVRIKGNDNDNDMTQRSFTQYSAMSPMCHHPPHHHCPNCEPEFVKTQDQKFQREQMTDSIFVFSKGACDEIFGICNKVFSDSRQTQRPLDQIQRNLIKQQKQQMDLRNMKVIMFAVRQLTIDEYEEIKLQVVHKSSQLRRASTLQTKDVKNGLNDAKAKAKDSHKESILIQSLEENSTLIGAVGIEDPTKGHVREILKTIQDLGNIQSIILTGDSLEATINFARSIKFIDEDPKNELANGYEQTYPVEDEEQSMAFEFEKLFSKRQLSRSKTINSSKNAGSRFNSIKELQSSKFTAAGFSFGPEQCSTHQLKEHKPYLTGQEFVETADKYESEMDSLIRQYERERHQWQAKKVCLDELKSSEKEKREIMIEEITGLKENLDQLDEKIEEKEREYRGFVENLRILARCTPEQRFRLALILKKFRKVTCITGDGIGETFAMTEASVAMTMNRTGCDVAKSFSDIVVGDNFKIFIECFKFGRNILENIRKYLQFQLSVAINLLAYITIGAIAFGDWPIQPSIILWVNFIMNLFGTSMLCTELPQSGTEILGKTQPLNKKKIPLFTQRMKETIIFSMIYQQLVLLLIFYNGSVYLETVVSRWILQDDFKESAISWKDLPMICKPNLKELSIRTSQDAIQKCEDYTFVFLVFFNMQMFHLFNCMVTHEDEFHNVQAKHWVPAALRKVGRILNLALIPRLNVYVEPQDDDVWHLQNQIMGDDGNYQLLELIKKTQQPIHRRQEQEYHEKMELKDNIRNSRSFLWSWLFTYFLQFLIIQRGYSLGIKVAPLSFMHYIGANIIGVGIIFSQQLSFFLLGRYRARRQRLRLEKEAREAMQIDVSHSESVTPGGFKILPHVAIDEEVAMQDYNSSNCSEVDYKVSWQDRINGEDDDYKIMQRIEQQSCTQKSELISEGRSEQLSQYDSLPQSSRSEVRDLPGPQC